MMLTARKHRLRFLHTPRFLRGQTAFRTSDGRLPLTGMLLLLLLITGMVAALPARAEAAPPPPPSNAAEDHEVRVQAPPQRPDVNRRILMVRAGDGSEPFVKWIGAKGAYLGVQLTELTPELRRHFGVPEEAGVMVGKVFDDSPAMAAGLQVGDVVTAIDGEPVGGAWDLQRAIVGRDAGDVVQLEVWREDSVQTLEATLEERERPKLELGQLEMMVPGLDDLPGVDEKTMRKALTEAREALREQGYELSVPFDEQSLEKMMKQLEAALQESGLQEKLIQQQEQREREIEKKMRELERKMEELERKLEDKR